MHVYRIYQASRLYADFITSGAAFALFSLYCVKVERRTTNKVYENAINRSGKIKGKGETEGEGDSSFEIDLNTVRELR